MQRYVTLLHTSVRSAEQKLLKSSFSGGGSVLAECSPSLSRELERVETEVTSSDELKLV